MYNIHCLDRISEKGLIRFSENYNAGAEMNQADAVLVRSTKMHGMEIPESLLAVARAGAGVNNIPLEEYAEKGIIVFNTPGANANAVKEQVIACLLLASRDLIGGNEWVKGNTEDEGIAKSAEKAKKAFAGHEIYGKKLGVIGLGAIGQLVANAAQSLGMEVYGYDPYLSVNAAWNLSRKIKHIQDVKDIYRDCDYITIHVPALDTTKGMIGEEAFAMMKDGVVIVNCARDILVNDEALSKAIKDGKVAKYVTDFANPAVVHMENVIVFPHLGASTEEAEENCAMMAADELMDYLENGNILHSVNYPDCDAGVCQTKVRMTVAHRNVPDTLSKITSALGASGINISSMANKSRGEYAYSVLDADSDITDEIVDMIKSIEGVIRVRILK